MSGPQIDPWGTPEVTGSQDVQVPEPLTGNGLTDNWIATETELVGWSVDVSLLRSAWWGADSKALAKSKKNTGHFMVLFKWKMPMVCSDEQRDDVALSFLNPNCMYESTFLDTKSWSISNWCKCLSSTLLTIGKRDIGLKNLTSLLLGSLGMGTALNSFQSAGHCPV